MFYHHLKTGKLIEEVLPNESSTLYGIYSSDVDSNTLILAFTSTTSPKKIYQVELSETSTKASQLLVVQVKGTNSSNYVTEQFEAISKDGTKVPYFIVHRKGKKKDGTSPAIMHVYGFYGDVESLYFDPALFSWMTSYDGTIVWAGVRGGSERGEEWHLVGSRNNKQKTFDDTIAVAQDLVTKKIAAPGKVIAEAAGAGGTFAAVVARQAPPNTFGAILSDIAPYDWFLLGRGRAASSQIDDFGDPYNATDFDVIRSWSPLQNIDPIKQKVFPPILLTPSDSNDLTVPAHSLKYIAQLQHSYPNSPNPLLMHMQKDAGASSVDGNQATLIKRTFHQQCFVQLALGLKQKV